MSVSSVDSGAGLAQLLLTRKVMDAATQQMSGLLAGMVPADRVGEVVPPGSTRPPIYL